MAADAPEAVHKSRVAIRRLRSTLRTFGALFDGEQAEALRKELGDDFKMSFDEDALNPVNLESAGDAAAIE